MNADLLATADHIETYGLYQGGRYFKPGSSDYSTCPSCVIGALRTVSGSTRFIVAKKLLASFLHSIGHTSIYVWSDDAPNEQVVINGLRAAAVFRPE